MSSTVGGNRICGQNEDVEADESTRNEDARTTEELDEQAELNGDTDALDLPIDALPDNPVTLEDELSAVQDGQPFIDASDGDYAQIGPTEDAGDNALHDAAPAGFEPSTPPRASPLDSDSIPDDTPSIQGSLLSSPARAASPTPRLTPNSRKQYGALQPFERRFEARPSASRSPSSRSGSGSPAFLNAHGRKVSLSSQVSHFSSDVGSDSTDTPQAPWEVIRWTKLRKISNQAFSEAGKRSFGRPTCLAVSALIAIGTSKGLVLGFDYHQTLKIIIGQGTKATECGSVTAIAISADYSTIACGHANGHIFTWEISRPSQPFLRIPPLHRGALAQSKHADGHVENTAILHIGFLGTRHTALVSADAGGMAFSHLATRGFGPVTRTVKSARLLGRYPLLNPGPESSRKPSSVLAFSPLPLGNVEQSTDQIGLTALLTPYLLVIVSTTPVAQTQHKAPRPKDASPHGTLSGCLAWFPAVKLKNPASGKARGVSDTKLVYCWSNVLTVLNVKILEHEDGADSNRPPSLEFSSRSRWRAEEAIVAVQWLGRSVLGVLTVSQRLLIVEDSTLQVTDSIDMLHHRLYHQDLYSQQLKSVVETLNSAEPSLHGVIADAFYMSFRAYKGRAFLLGFNDLTVGTLSNWADRLVALMTIGDYIAALKLATNYYAGGANNVTVGLPDDDIARHDMVRERLLAMVSASLNYAFAQYDSQRETRLRELACACFDACLGMQETDHLFGNVFDMFESAEEETVFITTLEPYILDGDVTMLPPDVVKTLVAHFISENQAARLEELLCRLVPLSFDLDQVTMLCRQHGLYDALIYLWTQGIGDFVTPMIDLLMLIKMLHDGNTDGEDLSDNPFFASSKKIFSYLAYSLTSRRYPNGETLDDNVAHAAKTEIYQYLFSGTPTAWPQGSKKVFRTSADAQSEPAFPYLVLLLHFDTPSLMSMLNEAFEDPFLNRLDDEAGMNGTGLANGHLARIGQTMTRQQIVYILLDVAKQQDLEPDQIIYLDMFIARSLPKYPGQLVLTGSLLDSILQQLCDPPDEDLREDCELSVEYLLSTYHPPDQSALIASLSRARFFRVLKATYRSARMFPELLETYFEDPTNKDDVFECVASCLRPSTGLSGKQNEAVRTKIRSHFRDLAEISAISTARTLVIHASDLLRPFLDSLEDTHQQFIFLRALLEPSRLPQGDASSSALLSENDQSPFTEQYVSLMCKHDPTHVADYVGVLPSGNLRLENVLSALEESGVVDATVVLLARDGMARDGMDRLVAHLHSLEHALRGLVNAAMQSPDAAATQDNAMGICEEIEKYTKVGIWLCRGQSADIKRHPRPLQRSALETKEDDLDLDEFLWLNLVDAIVQVSQNVTASFKYLEDHPNDGSYDTADAAKLTASLRSNVQQAFTALLAATSTTIRNRPNESPQLRHRWQDGLSFLRVLRAFLTRAASTAPSLADLRAVLADIFAAYTFEEAVLSLANELLGSDVFADIAGAHAQRQRGWRPRSQVCELCKRRAWGPGTGEAAWDEWVSREADREEARARKRLEKGAGGRVDKGKAKSPVPPPSRSADDDESTGGGEAEVRSLALVVFACRHAVHRACLDDEFRESGRPGLEMYRCPLCVEGK